MIKLLKSNEVDELLRYDFSLSTNYKVTINLPKFLFWWAMIATMEKKNVDYYNDQIEKHKATIRRLRAEICCWPDCETCKGRQNPVHTITRWTNPL